MVFHMKTTLVIDDGVMRRLKAEAARQGRTISELVESALRRLLEALESAPAELPRLPAFAAGTPRVDVSNRDALYDFMEADEADSWVAESPTARDGEPERP